MLLLRFLKVLSACTSTLVVGGVLAGMALGQEPLLATANPGSVQPSPLASFTPPQEPPQHKFWDGKNRLLFAGVAAFSAADFAVTRANLNSGGQELNPVTRVFSGSTAGLAVNFAGETVGVIGLSYFFHKIGHHKLERIVSVVNIGSSAGAVTYGMIHR